MSKRQELHFVDAGEPRPGTRSQAEKSIRESQFGHLVRIICQKLTLKLSGGEAVRLERDVRPEDCLQTEQGLHPKLLFYYCD